MFYCFIVNKNNIFLVASAGLSESFEVDGGVV